MAKMFERLFFVWMFVAIGYQAISTVRTLDTAMEHYTIHLVLVLGLIALEGSIVCAKSIAATARKLELLGFLTLFVTVVGCGIYLYFRSEALEMEQPFLSQPDFYVGVAIVCAVLILTWLIWGWILSLLCALCAMYLAFGYLLPDAVASVQLASNVVVSYLAGMGGPRGIFTYMPLSADTIFLLIVYGGLLHGSQVIEMFTEIGKAIGNLLRGGVALSAIMASSLIGMVTGQAVGNIALAGSVTIPTMVRSGFTREQAGAVECLGSNGSQLIPPVMGLGAFLMAANLNVPYVQIALAGIVPSILYELTVTIGLFSMISASPEIPYQRQPVDWRKVFWIVPSFSLSFTVLLVLLYFRFSASLAALWGIMLLVLLSLFRPKQYRPTLSDILHGCREGSLAGAKLALILAAIGIAVQMLTTTGLGVLLGQWMIYGSAGNVAIGLILGAVISLFIGMGLPTPAAYSLIAIVVVPSLINLGMSPLVAHFFGFYYAIFSSLTPPVAVAVFTAIRISRGTFRGTVLESFKLAGVCLMLPILFVQFPTILDLTHPSVPMVGAIGLYVLATYMTATSIYGKLRGSTLKSVERWILLAGPGSFIAYFATKSMWWILPAAAASAWVLARLRLRPVAEHTFPSGQASLSSAPTRIPARREAD